MNIKLDRDVIFLAEAGEEGTQHLRHRLHGEGALAGDRGRVRHGGGRRDRGRERQGASRADQQHGEIAAAHTPGRRTAPPGTGRGPMLAERRGAPGAGGGTRRHVADADAAERDHARLLRAAGRDLAARTRPRATATSSIRPRGGGGPLTSAESEPGHYSILRTSVVPTIINIGFRSNVIPSEGEAMLDVRALPDEDMTKFVAELRRVIDDACDRSNSRPRPTRARCAALAHRYRDVPRLREGRPPHVSTRRRCPT